MRKDEFEQLFRDYYPKVVAFCVAKGCTTEEARDLAQETFLRVYRAMETFRGDSSAKTWIFRIARNLLLNERRYWKSRGGWHRTRSFHDMETGESGDQPGAQPAAPGPTALDELLQEERIRLLWEAIEELPPQQRACVCLRLVHELKYREIAAATGKSIETVKSLLHEGKEKLRLKLGSEVPSLDGPDEGETVP